MHKLIIKNFGPIESCEVKLNKITILIGPQSSGKSTISKLFYFFLHIRDEFSRFIIKEYEKDSNKLIIDFSKLIRRRFIEFWGPIPQDNDLYLKYYYNDDVFIEIKLDSAKHKFIDPTFSKNINDQLTRHVEEFKSKSVTNDGKFSFFNNASVLANEMSSTEKIENLINESKKLFNFKEELLFIPAGRSLLSTISDQLQNIHPHQLDYPMRIFIERINLTKSFFSKSLEDLVKEKQVLGDEGVWFSATRKVSSLIRKILKGEYIHDKEGGKLYINNKHFTKINFASSGQQESIWILLSLFLVVLEKAKVKVFIEEPEAHLFPIAQKEIVELMSYMAKTLETKFILTTHSPYVLSALNNHIYANELGKNYPEKVAEIIHSNSWVKYNDIAGYFVSNGKLSNLCDDKLKVIKTEIVDSASDKINLEYDNLFNIENEVASR